ncbi:MAG TPA: hypothetical protein VGW12_07985, partial [Pyrinomonadaceae bacterium]|nr:hypothetical protein [Pyrinomonadaceae bacterium]
HVVAITTCASSFDGSARTTVRPRHCVILPGSCGWLFEALRGAVVLKRASLCVYAWRRQSSASLKIDGEM